MFPPVTHIGMSRPISTQSDGNGMFRFPSEKTAGAAFLIVAEYAGDRLASGSTYQTHAAYSEPKAQPQTVFFTDRSLYRPGQTIHYKGICISLDPAAGKYQTLAGQQLTVVFRDVNGQEIARQQHACNNYGSFSGSFTAPRDRLLGRMSLERGGWSVRLHRVSMSRSTSGPSSACSSMRPPKHPSLGTEVVVPGKATAYTGASIGSAQVEWRVVRQVRFPIWNWWWRWSLSDESIAGHRPRLGAHGGRRLVCRSVHRQAGPVGGGGG